MSKSRVNEHEGIKVMNRCIYKASLLDINIYLFVLKYVIKKKKEMH
jgi:hypothetical protein